MGDEPMAEVGPQSGFGDKSCDICALIFGDCRLDNLAANVMSFSVILSLLILTRAFCLHGMNIFHQSMEWIVSREHGTDSCKTAWNDELQESTA